MEFLTDLLTLETAFLIVSALIGILFAKSGIEILSDLKDIFQVLGEAVSEDGPDGKTINKEEQERIRKEVMDLVYKVWQKYRGTLLSRVGKIIGNLKFW